MQRESSKFHTTEVPISSELPWPIRLLRVIWESPQKVKPAVESDCTRGGS